MLFDLGWSEILLIGTVALVFIGPKDLPKAMRVAGYWMRKARTLSREFQSGIDQMIREAELEEMRQDLKKAAEFDLDKEFHNTIDPSGSLRDSLKPPELPNFPTTEPATTQASGTAEGIAGAPAIDVGLVPVTGSETASSAEPAGFHQLEPFEPVPIVPGPESEPDQIAASEPLSRAASRAALPPEPGAAHFEPPKP